MSKISKKKQIGDLLPNDKDFSLTFQITEITNANQKQIQCRIVDEKGIVNALFDRYVDKLLVGQAYSMQHLKVKIVDHHIQVLMTDKTVIERIPNQISYKDKVNDVSKKSFVVKQELTYLQKLGAKHEKTQQIQTQSLSNNKEIKAKDTQKQKEKISGKKQQKRVIFQQKPIIIQQKNDYKSNYSEMKPKYQQKASDYHKNSLGGYKYKNIKQEKGINNKNEGYQRKVNLKDNRNNGNNQTSEYNQGRQDNRQQFRKTNKGDSKRNNQNTKDEGYSDYSDQYMDKGRKKEEKSSTMGSQKNYKKNEYKVARRVERDTYNQRKPMKQNNSNHKQQNRQCSRIQEYIDIKQTAQLVGQFVNVHVFVNIKKKTVIDNQKYQVLLADQSGSVWAEFKDSFDLSESWYYLDNLEVSKGINDQLILKETQMTESKVDLKWNGRYDLNPVS